MSDADFAPPGTLSTGAFFRRFWKLLSFVGASVVSLTVFNIVLNIYIGVPHDHCAHATLTELANGFDPPPRIEQMIGGEAPEIRSPLLIQTRPVTVAELRDYLPAAPEAVQRALAGATWGLGADNTPARDVPWIAAEGYAKWKSQRDTTGCTWRLPTVAEWRHAAAREADGSGSYDAGTSDRSHWLWGIMEWTGDECRMGGRMAAGAALAGLNSDRGGADPYPATRCLDQSAVAGGAHGVGFRLVREPKGRGG